MRRRDFILGLTLAAGAAGRTSGEAPPARTRKEIHSLSEDERVALRAAVKAMKEGDALHGANDPRAWTYWTNLHSMQCKHSMLGGAIAAYFLPWHRAYLWYFEKALHASGYPSNMALPYWDWHRHRSLPAAFQGGSANPLWHGKRGGDVETRTLQPAYSGFNPRPNSFMYKDGFSYVLEVGDHDAVHALVGGDMGNQLRAAADPVFFLHHANVDRLWHIWQRNCTDPQRALSDTWRRGKLQLGRDEEVMAGDLLHISSLGYGYDDTRPIAVDRPLVRASNAVLSGPIVESAQRGPVLPGTAFDLRERGLTVSVRGPDPRHFERGGRLRLALRVRRLSSKSVHMGIYAGLTSTGGVPLTPPIGVISSFQAGRRLADDRGMEMAFEVPDEFRSADGSVEISFVPAVLTRSNEPVLRIESLALIRTAAALQPLR